jgi:hypothetical protein
MRIPARQRGANVVPGSPRRDDDRRQSRRIGGRQEKCAVHHTWHRQKFSGERLERRAFAGDLHHILTAPGHFEPAGARKVRQFRKQPIR